jgi:nucleotide-binding universal stress UspA family protein
MAFPFKRILCPIDFDENAVNALALAAQMARQTDGTVLVLHIVPMIIPPTGMPVYVDLYKEQEKVATARLKEMAGKHLRGVKHELSTHAGEVASTVLRCEKRLGADVVVMATHGRRGFSRFFLGSVAEMVLRESTCPVLTVQGPLTDRELVGHWMTHSPLAASPNDKLSSVQARMREGGFRSMPVLDEGRLVGIITDRDLRQHAASLESTEVRRAMTGNVLTVTSQTPAREAARLLRERKVGAIPVMQDGELVGIVTGTDLLGAFIEHD